MKPTQEQVIAWAREVSGVEFPISTTGVKIGMSPEHLERFATLAYEAGRKDENEACARVCEPQEEWDDPLTAWHICTAICARREQ